jgi:hypothetical protein
MVPTFKSKTLIIDLYSMNPLHSRGYYFFTTLYQKAEAKLTWIEMANGLRIRCLFNRDYGIHEKAGQFGEWFTNSISAIRTQAKQAWSSIVYCTRNKSKTRQNIMDE